MDEPAPLKPAPVPVVPVKAPPEPVKASAPEPLFDELIMDFGDSAASFKPTAPAIQPTPSKSTEASFESISVTDEDFSAHLPFSSAPTQTAAYDNSLIELDMSDFSLDLEVPMAEVAPHAGHVPVEAPLEDPLETKFSLAEEFRSLGDPDGARVLAEEVLLEATGPLKVKTQAFLNALS
jgi:pilus assembly protein FimV